MQRDLDKAEPRPIWERQVGESAKAYFHFCAYREMRRDLRGIRGLARQLDRGTDMLFTWSKRFHWKARVDAWDAYCEAVAREAQLEVIRDGARVQAQLALDFFEKVRQRLVGDDEKDVQALDFNRLDAKDLAALANVAAKLQSASEESAGVKPDEATRIEISLAPGILEPSVAGAGHRVVEARARVLPPASDESGGEDD